MTRPVHEVQTLGKDKPSSRQWQVLSAAPSQSMRSEIKIGSRWPSAGSRCQVSERKQPVWSRGGASLADVWGEASGDELGVRWVSFRMLTLTEPGTLSVNILVPCYNEEDNIVPLTAAIEEALRDPSLQSINNLTYRIVFVDNCSVDSTWSRICQLAADNSHVNGLRHAINYGQLLSPFMALCQSEADVSVLISADFEEPPALIPKLITTYLKTGAAVIAPVRKADKESAWRRLSRRLGYRLMSKVSDSNSISGFHGFGLYTSDAIRAFRNYREVRPYIRLIPSHLGLNIHCIPYGREQRLYGKSSNNFGTLFELAVDGVIQFSAFPPKLITSVAVLQWFLAVIVSLVLLAIQIPSGISPQFLILLLTYVGVSFLILAVGVAVQYLYRIYAMQTGRPYYRIDSLCGDLKQLSLAK